MCGPLAIPLVTLAITAVTTVATVASQQSQANAAAAAQNQFNRTLEKNALTARNANVANLEVERTTAADDTREQINQNALAARRAEATAITAAGEAGISGLSVDALLRDLRGQAGFDNATAYENYLRTDWQINNRRENIQNNYVSTLNSTPQPTIQGPDYLGAGLRIGQAAVSAYGGYQDNVRRLNAAQNK